MGLCIYCSSLRGSCIHKRKEEQSKTYAQQLNLKMPAPAAAVIFYTKEYISYI